MIVLGITGSAGTGKSTVAKYIIQKGATGLDADKIVHQLIHPRGKCFKAVVRQFGKNILANGQIDRSKLAGIVFNSEEQLKKLTTILHPKVREILKAKIAALKNTRKILVLDVPLLYESGMDRLCDYVIVVKASQKEQIRRLKVRQNIPKKQALQRIRAQMPLKDKIRLADIIIDNENDLKQTKKQVEELWERLMQKKNVK